MLIEMGMKAYFTKIQVFIVIYVKFPPNMGRNKRIIVFYRFNALCIPADAT